MFFFLSVCWRLPRKVAVVVVVVVCGCCGGAGGAVAVEVRTGARAVSKSPLGGD